jgi:hypothetical protein
MDLKDFVLGKFTPEQIALISEKTPHYLSGLDLLLSRGADAAIVMDGVATATSEDQRWQPLRQTTVAKAACSPRWPAQAHSHAPPVFGPFADKNVEGQNPSRSG